MNFSNGTNCLASTLNDIQSANGPLTLSSLIQLVTLGNVSNIPSNVTCSDCTKAAYNILRSDVPSIVSDASGGLEQQCGANFTGKTTICMDEMKINNCCDPFRHLDGNTPAGITNSVVSASGSSNQTSQTSDTMGFVVPGLGVSAFTVISTVVALL